MVGPRATRAPMSGVTRTRAQWIGAPLRRREEPALLRGKAKFVADIEPPETLHAAFVRSPLAHARIAGIDVSSALEVEGVVDIVHASVLDSVPGPIPVRIHPMPKLEPYLQYALAIDKVRYVGEPIAVVVATNRYIAEDAAQLIEAEFDALPAVVDIEAAAGSESPLLFEDEGSNVALEFSSTYGEVDAAFAAAAHVISGDFIVNRHSGVPMETRGLVAQWDLRLARLTMWGPTKVIHANRDVVANLLGLAREQVRFVEPAVGGGFGIRGEIYPEDLVIPFLAMRLGRPVKWIEDRAEHMVSANQSRDQRHRASLAFDADGRILGMRSRFYVDQGAYLRTHGVRVAEISAHTQPGPYKIPAYRANVSCVVTNKTPTGTYRAPGRFEINFVREQLMDMAARELGVEAAALRRRNLIQPEDMPYSPGTRDFDEPVVFDTGDIPAVFERTLEAIGYDQARQLQASMPPGKRLGVGVVPFIEDGGLGGLGPTPGEYARVAIELGRPVIHCGAGDLGQGFGTMLSQICADQLGLDPVAVDVVRGDTDLIPQGGGTWASRGAILAGNATLEASRGVAAKLREAAARLLDADPADVELVDGRAVVDGCGDLTFAEIQADVGEISVETVYTTPRMTYAPGAQALVIEVDLETGVITLLKHVVAYDVGRAINPLIVRGQIEGGAAQGIGGALLEEFVYSDDGQPMATSFMDYLLPTLAEIPDTEVLLIEDATNPLNELGVKGTGEVGPAAAGAAIASALTDAIAVSVDRLPVTPERVLEWLERTRGGAPA
jgi:CO/xanthine dehydrogenase Mo-binding subunit